MTATEFLLACKLAGLTMQEMQEMTIGMCLDYIEEYTVFRYPQTAAPQQATQADIQRLKGR